MHSVVPSQTQRRRVYSVKTFAHEIDVSERTVWRWIHAGKIQTVQISIGRIGIPGSELDRVSAQGVQ
jgi:predicted site-specific integrase-resolvase